MDKEKLISKFLENPNRYKDNLDYLNQTEIEALLATVVKREPREALCTKILQCDWSVEHYSKQLFSYVRFFPSLSKDRFLSCVDYLLTHDVLNNGFSVATYVLHSNLAYADDFLLHPNFPREYINQCIRAVLSPRFVEAVFTGNDPEYENKFDLYNLPWYDFIQSTHKKYNKQLQKRWGGLVRTRPKSLDILVNYSWFNPNKQLRREYAQLVVLQFLTNGDFTNRTAFNLKWTPAELYALVDSLPIKGIAKFVDQYEREELLYSLYTYVIKTHPEALEHLGFNQLSYMKTELKHLDELVSTINREIVKRRQLPRHE